MSNAQRAHTIRYVCTLSREPLVLCNQTCGTSSSALSCVHHHQHCLVYITISIVLCTSPSALSCVHHHQHCLVYITISIVFRTSYQHCLVYITISIVFCTSYQHCLVYITISIVLCTSPSALSSVHHISIVLCTLYQHCLVYITISIVLRNAWIAVLGRKAGDLVLFLLPHSMLYVLLSPLFVEIQTQCPVEQQTALRKHY